MNLEEIKYNIQNFFGFPTSKLEYIGQGFDSYVFGMDNKVLKLICPFRGYSAEESMIAEVKGFSIMESVADLPLPIPHLYDHGAFKYSDGKEPLVRKIEFWLLMSRLEGHEATLNEIMAHPAAMDDLARFLVRIPQEKPPEPDTIEDTIEEITIQAKQHASPEEWTFMSQLVDDFYATTKSEKILVHGDMNVHNILINNGRISGIIDFCETRYSELEIDLNPILATDEQFYQVFVERYLLMEGEYLIKK